jgi:hypothetical protein
MKIAMFLSIAATIATLTSCQKEGAEQEKASAAVAVSIKPANTATTLRIAQADAAGLRTEGISVQWTSAKASATQLKFEAEKGGSEVEFKSNVQQTVDLFNAVANLGNLSIPAGTYDEVELKAVLNPSGNTPALEMTGTVTTGGGTIPVVFTASETIELKGEKKNVTLSGSSLQQADIPLNFALLVRGLTAADFENASQTGGKILVTSASNNGLYAKLLKNLRELKEETEFHK